MRYQTPHTLALLVVLLLAQFALVACDDEKATTDGPEGKVEGSKEGALEAKTRTSAVDKLSKEESLRYSLTDSAHLAVRSTGGTLQVDMGKLESHKHINGGWRTGWNVETRKGKGADYYEADSKSARVFFKHEEGGFDRVIVRMKAVKSENKVVFYLNDNAISNTKITGEWADYEVKIPAKFTRKGENQFMMRFTHKTEASGRKQVAHIDKVTIVSKGGQATDAPTGPAVQTMKLGDEARPSLVAATAQTFTYRLQVPKGDAKLALSFGGKVAGGKVSVSVEADKMAKKVLLDKDAPAGSWEDAVLDMKAFSGQVVELKLKAAGTWAEGQSVAFAQPGLFVPNHKDESIAATGSGEAARNVVVYLIDTLRYDKIGAYNKKSSVPTPHLDAFAKDSTLYESAYDTENWTKPSTATILTGLYPETHGAKTDTAKLPKSATMVSEHLKKNGFKTGSFIANGYVSDAFGFDKGWDHYTNYIRERKVTDAGKLVDDSLGWIDKNKGERFFAYIHTIDPHVPYSAPGEWKEKFFKGKYEGKIRPQATGNQLADIKTGKMELNKTDKRYLEALYDGEIAYNDNEFGRLIKGLKDRGVYDNTLVIVLVDHGEEFWDHGSVGHGHSVYEELVHTPMLVRYPAQTARGRRLPHVISVADMAPTMVDVLGLPPMEGIEGYSFADTFDGNGKPHPRVGLSDFLFRKKSIRAGRYHWVTVGRNGELYDIEKDPTEQKNLIKSHMIGRAYTRSLFGAFMGAKNKAAWWEPGAAVKAVVKKHEADEAEVGDDLQKQLEALGYVDGAGADVSAQEDKKRQEEEDEK